MANVIIKDDARREHEENILKSFRKDGANVTPGDRDAAATIAARSAEAISTSKRMEAKHDYR